MKDKGELTTKALLVLKKYLECGCDKKKTAKQLERNYSSVYQQLRQPYVRNIFKMLLVEKGITLGKLAKVLDEGLDAKKVISAQVIVTPNNPDPLKETLLKLKKRLRNYLKKD